MGPRELHLTYLPQTHNGHKVKLPLELYNDPAEGEEEVGRVVRVYQRHRERNTNSARGV